MPRPKSIKDEDLIRAARDVFVERGIHATSAEVAKRAGVSEGTLFNRFKTKFDLFRAAMTPELEEPAWLVALADRVGQGDVRQSLNQAGVDAIGFFRRLMPLIMLSWSSVGATGGLPDVLTVPNPPPIRVLRQLTRILEAEMKLKRLRKHEAEVVARAFLGGMMQYVFFEMLLAVRGEPLMTPQAYVKTLVNLLWNGLDPNE